MAPADSGSPGPEGSGARSTSPASEAASSASGAASPEAEPDPIATGDALRGLGDRAFVELVTKLWERREWVVEEVRERESRYVDLAVHRDWPVAQQGLLRIERPETESRVGGTEVRHFVGTVQRAEVDWSTLVLPRETSRSVRRRAAEFGVRVVDVDDLARLIHRREAHDLLAAHVDRPLVVEADPIVARAPAPVARVLRRYDVVDRAETLLTRRLPPNPTTEDVAGLTFTGFRVSLSVVLATFLLTVAAPGGSAAFWLLMGAFLLGTYGVLLPLFAVDVYLVRRFEPGPWTPTWWHLASFLLAPVLFVVGGLYWHRRRQRTPSGRSRAWFRVK
ncbi:restriction endonuclease [Haloparvum sp. PAK95]|uniref:restriction endonuclease n=1 Tax=Haloparvum sp. PAK95 TaxID=3418962 RepID=UPI003D2EBFD0